MVRRTIAGFLTGFAVALIGVAVALPHCPSEDSCRGDYQHHWFGSYWTGKEMVP